jgi:hypothetical protein
MTPRGTVVKEGFRIVVPELVLEGLENEYSKLGETAYIIGKNMDIYGLDSINGGYLQIGDSIITRLYYDYGYAEPRLAFRMPIVMPAGSQVTYYKKDASTGEIKMEHKFPGRYRDNRNTMFTLSNWTLGGTKSISDGMSDPTLPDSISGNYALIIGPHDGNWHSEFWYESNLPPWQIGIQQGAGDTWTVGDLVGPSSDLMIVFELNIPTPWSGGTRLDVKWRNDYIYEFAPFEETKAPYMTNGWKTIRIPLSQFYKKVGDNKEYYSEDLTDGMIMWEWKYSGIYYQHSGVNERRVICWDNMRIIPINK